MESSAPAKVDARGQYLAVLSVSIGALAAGSVLGYSSPALYQLRQAAKDALENTTSAVTDGVQNGSQDLYQNGSHLALFPSNYTALSEQELHATHNVILTTLELSWFSSIYGIGALVGGIVSSPMQNFLGRRGAMLGSVPVALLGWLLIGVGVSFPLMVTGRLLTGVFTGVNSVVINTFVGEITSSDVRGRLGCSFEVMFSAGMLFSFGLGSVVSWSDLALLHSLPPIVFSVLMVGIHESPVYLISKGRVDDARRALRFFNGSQYDIDSGLENEQRFQKEVREEGFTWNLLRQSYIYRPLMIASALAVLKQLSGINVVVFNLATIFQRSGTGLAEHVSSAISVSMQLVAAVLASCFIERVGRKPLLMGSFTVMAAMLACLGLFFYLLEKEPVWTDASLQWLPLVSVSGYLLSFGMGIGSICWIIIGELFPPNVRESAGAFVIAVNDIATFLVLFTFDEMQDQLTTYGYYWMLAGCCVFSAIFSAVAFKETKGKTLQEITLMFGGGSIEEQSGNTSSKKTSYGTTDESSTASSGFDVQ